MKLVHAAVVIALSLSLSSCVVSEQTYVQHRTIIKKRPDFQAKLIRECVHDVSSLSSEKRALYAELVDLSPAAFPGAFCKRVMRAYLNGRLTYQDYKDIMHDRPTARVLRIFKGK